ncbi:MAG: hypothetical protein ACI8XO_003675 [Verrucomicrobiales bacterium]|jgi:hypothetical protein
MLRPSHPLILLPLVTCLAWTLGSCGKKDASSVEKSPATEVVTASNTASNTPQAIPSPPSALPELQAESFIAPLRDAYDRIDPVKDGWESEAFSGAAMEQLHLIETLLAASAPIDEKGLAPIVAPSITSTALRPANLIKAYDGNHLQVLRPQIPPAESSPGLAVLVIRLNELKTAGENLLPHLKIYRVDRKSESVVSSSVIVDITADSESSRRQINATWTCTWLTADETAPRLNSIQLIKYEEVVQEDSHEPLFADATAALLGNNTSYQEQFLTHTDHWRARLPRTLGLDAVANHGLAIGDINGDELDDLYICQQGGLPNRLFIQEPDGSLRDVTEESGTGWLDYCASALFVDLDNDGDRDLLVSQDFRILGMENDGSGKFVLSFGASTKAQSFSLAAADYDNNGLIDFYICGYNPSAAAIRGGAMGEPMPFHDANNGGANMLWHNDGNWEFSDQTQSSGLGANNSRFTFAAAWEDYDNDGDQDLYIANDYGRNCLYRNDHGRFTDVAPSLGVEDTSSGMSVSWSDFNHDGHMDIYTSNMFSSAGNRITYQRQFKEGVPENVRQQFQHIALGNTLFQASPDGAAFQDVGATASVQRARWAWGSKFVDFNNDGLDDILVANGFISTDDTGDL